MIFLQNGKHAIILTIPVSNARECVHETDFRRHENLKICKNLKVCRVLTQIFEFNKTHLVFASYICKYISRFIFSFIKIASRKRLILRSNQKARYMNVEIVIHI